MTSPPASTKSSNPRNIILCFDGTGNKFGENSNVVRFFRSLIKDEPEKQLVYYQPGIGTYNSRQFLTRTFSSLVSSIDQGVAIHLSEHAKEGYQFIMRNYRKGDKISVFGFSRGAHTARVVAGMLYKIGLLPAHNDQQIDFAFSVYQLTGNHGYELSKLFKRTFAIPVTVEFVGVWDTVSSVGIIPRTHPYTSVNYAVKYFRHALALDERRARFRPNVWNEPTLEREQELDVDEPDIETPPTGYRDDWTYKPPNRDICDVKEVWFSGCHADVGGGSHDNKITDSLSQITLRWMIKECLVNTDIQFNLDYLRSIDFDLLELVHDLTDEGVDVEARGFDIKAIAEEAGAQSHEESAAKPETPNVIPSSLAALPRIANALILARLRADVLAQIFDQLAARWPWWVLEFIPMLATYQQPDGTWIRKRMRNLGQGRYIPFHDDEVKVHESVEQRMKETRDPKNKQDPYTPCAYNWDVVQDSGMLKYVK